MFCVNDDRQVLRLCTDKKTKSKKTKDYLTQISQGKANKGIIHLRKARKYKQDKELTHTVAQSTLRFTNYDFSHLDLKHSFGI